MQRLKQYMQDTGTSQTRLAELVEVRQPTVWEWLNGESTPTTANLKKLAVVTGISMEKLIETHTPVASPQATQGSAA